ALSPSQIVDKAEDEDAVGFSFDSILADTETDATAMVDPGDIAFEASPAEPEEDLPAFDPPPMKFALREPEPEVAPAPEFEPEPEPVFPAESFAAPEPEPDFAPQASIAQAAPLPD